MIKQLALLLCAILILGLLPGCNQEAQPYVPTGNGLSDGDSGNPVHTPSADAVAEISLLYDPDDELNPYRCMHHTNRVLFSLIYQGLFTVDRNYQVSPMLCESYNVSVDMRAYTFYICDARFSDGTALTAEDVAASLNAARESAWYGGRLQHVTSVSAYGNAVMVELSTPMENLPLLLDIPIVKASQVNADAPLGSGPYRMDGASLRRVAGWWCSAELCLQADTVSLIEAGNSGNDLDSFEIDGVSLVCSDPSSIYFVEFHRDYELWECENGLFVYLACNSESEVFSNDAVRASLTHAINRDLLVDSYYNGFARSAQLPCSPLSPLYTSSLAVNYGYVPGRLKTVLEREGLGGSAITLLVNGDDTTRVRVAYAIAEMLEAEGLVVTVRESESGKFTEDLKKTKGNNSYDLYLAQTRLPANMDLSAFFGIDTPLNYGGLSSPGIYAVSLEALANSGNYYSLFEMIMDDGLLCPVLFQSYAVFGQRGALSSLNPSRDNLFFYSLDRTMEDALIGS